MGQKSKVVAIIPARGGSKSIPLKNIKLFCGRPLIYWVIDAAIEAKYIDNVYVSTDSEVIKNEVENYRCINAKKTGIDKLEVISRGDDTATDTASTESVMLEFAHKMYFDYIYLLQATSPLTTSYDIDNSMELYLEKNADSLLSLVVKKNFQWEYHNDEVISINYSPACRPRRQDFDGLLLENGAIYITNRQCLLESQCRVSGKIIPYIMDEDTHTEIDEEKDWIIAEQLMQHRLIKKEESLQIKIKKIKLVIMDCDGVLTDAGMYYSCSGDELKKFNTKDGMAINLLHKKGIHTAIITGENTDIVANRARKLNISELHMGIDNKGEVIRKIAKKLMLSKDQIAYIGDDINDIPAFQEVGLRVAVADAVKELKVRADIVTEAKGGNGAVRELCDLILYNMEN